MTVTVKYMWVRSIRQERPGTRIEVIADDADNEVIYYISPGAVIPPLGSRVKVTIESDPE